MALKGYKTLAEAVEGLKQRGFAANFELLNKTFQPKGGYKTRDNQCRRIQMNYFHVTSSQQRWTKVSKGGKLLAFCSLDRTQRSISIPAGSVSPPGSVRFTG